MALERTELQTVKYEVYAQLW